MCLFLIELMKFLKEYYKYAMYMLLNDLKMFSIGLLSLIANEQSNVRGPIRDRSASLHALISHDYRTALLRQELINLHKLYIK